MFLLDPPFLVDNLLGEPSPAKNASLAATFLSSSSLHNLTFFLALSDSSVAFLQGLIDVKKTEVAAFLSRRLRFLSSLFYDDTTFQEEFIAPRFSIFLSFGEK